MKKILLLSMLFTSFVFAITKEEVYHLYQNHDYKHTCQRGVWILNEYKNDDAYQSIVAISCVKADMLNTAIRISKTMNHTKLGRNNASYIATLYLIKRLLLQVVWDNIDISHLSLPKSNHHLSIVFENISHNNFSKTNNVYTITADGNKYILSPEENNKIAIKIYKNNVLVSKHVYW